jgi:hypothetical protein
VIALSSFYRTLLRSRSALECVGDGMNGITTPTLTRVDPWQEVYKAALFETDKKKIPAPMADAEQAIVARARELFFSGTDSIEEDQALDDALYALRALQNCPGLGSAPPDLAHGLIFWRALARKIHPFLRDIRS